VRQTELEKTLEAENLSSGKTKTIAIFEKQRLNFQSPLDTNLKRTMIPLYD